MARLTRFLKNKLKAKNIAFLLVLVGVVLAGFFALPVVEFDTPFSKAVRDRSGRLLSARTATDEQWRLPLSGGVPDRYRDALLAFEDKRFYNHKGIDPWAVGRALKLNFAQGRVVSGASTLTMQVVRLSQGQNERSIPQKAWEALLALRLEWAKSKSEILELYASHAPFGGNVVGIDAACWKYFARRPGDITWAEAATLAVLPNSPSLVRPGKNQKRLLQKRNALLEKLKDIGHLDAETYTLALLESLPGRPVPFPDHAPHALARKTREDSAQTTLDAALQQHFNRVLKRQQRRLAKMGVHNLAAIAVDVDSGETRAYVGNVYSDGKHGDFVDVARAERSPGSTLKPFLYEAALSLGTIQADEILPDIPMRTGGFAPENFDKRFDGAVPASLALSRSLNVPTAALLRRLGVSVLWRRLQNAGVSTLVKSPGHYGLSLILGGVEMRLDEMALLYADLARATLGKTTHKGGKLFISDEQKESKIAFEAASSYLTLEALLGVERPGEESTWKQFQGGRKVAWKTGTSFGFRDAWAIGVTPSHVVGVWVGNASGEGRAGLTGHNAAAPVLFELFDFLPRAGWFSPPKGLHSEELCAHSGMRASEHCKDTRGAFVTEMGREAQRCQFCQTHFLDEQSGLRVDASCVPFSRMKAQRYFVLPPIMSAFAKLGRGVKGDVLPAMSPLCGQDDTPHIGVITPKAQTQLYIPRELNGELGQVVFEATHTDPDARLFWHIDETYLGSTEAFHQLEVHPSLGKHVLRVVDEKGQSVVRPFQVLSDS